jgi:dethiobiotin synthetase
MKDVPAAATSLSTGAIGWLAPINEVLTTISLIVSTIAALIVVVPWIKRKFKK